MREFKDVDMLVTREYFDELVIVGEPFVASGGDEGLKFDVDGVEVEVFYKWAPGEWDEEKLIREGEVIDGVKFVGLNEVRKWKMQMGREKDILDVKIIDNILKNGKK